MRRYTALRKKPVSQSNTLPQLGELELALLQALWANPEQSALQLQQALPRPQQCSLSTVQSTLERLHRKLLLRRQWLPGWRLCKQLCLAGNDNGEFISIDSTAPVAFTLGWLKPRIFISAGMQAVCSTDEIDCILHHERAHLGRHDNIRLLLARLFTAPLPGSWSYPAMDDLKLCCEKACDLSASALIRVARIQQASSPSASLAFVGNKTEQRILALLDEPQSAMANQFVFITVSVTLLFILTAINPLHRAIELIP